jgi:hypothetical protein
MGTFGTSPLTVEIGIGIRPRANRNGSAFAAIFASARLTILALTLAVAGVATAFLLPASPGVPRTTSLVPASTATAPKASEAPPTGVLAVRDQPSRHGRIR